MASAAARGWPPGAARRGRALPGHRRSARDSVGLDAAARAANLADRVRWLPAGGASAGAPVVLIDDVLTTGAPAAARAGCCGRPGSSVCGVLVLASVPGWITAR